MGRPRVRFHISMPWVFVQAGKTTSTTTTTKRKKPTKAAMKKIAAANKKQGKLALKAAGKKTALYMKERGIGIFAPKTLSPELATICGGAKMPRTDVMRHLWAYIKGKNLLNGRMITPDATLRAVVPVIHIDMLKIGGYVSKHLS